MASSVCPPPSRDRDKRTKRKEKPPPPQREKQAGCPRSWLVSDHSTLNNRRACGFPTAVEERASLTISVASIFFNWLGGGVFFGPPSDLDFHYQGAIAVGAEQGGRPHAGRPVSSVVLASADPASSRRQLGGSGSGSIAGQRTTRDANHVRTAGGGSLFGSGHSPAPRNRACRLAERASI